MKLKTIKRLLIASLVAVMSVTAIGCGNTQTTTNTGNKTLTKVRLNEVARSVFYAPMYAAINEGFFKEEGLDIDLSTGQGADATYSKMQIIGRVSPQFKLSTLTLPNNKLLCLCSPFLNL